MSSVSLPHQLLLQQVARGVSQRDIGHFPDYATGSLPRSRFLDVTQRSPKKTAVRESMLLANQGNIV